ncbi:MAG: dihydroorotate dehydrogenase [Actinobacteria bacterium]|nr:dihydroorotate dehydrogenase [Actinomycetota bacterium]
MSVVVGRVRLRHAVMTASGTSGHADELAAYGDLASLGAVVVKSLSVMPWAGNPAPRVHPVAQGMLNAVGLQGPGMAAWLRDDLPRLATGDVAVVVSIWGRTVEEYREAATVLGAAVRDSHPIVAVEVNLSCPNMSGHGIFAHDADLSAAVIGAVVGQVSLPVWAKLSPNTDRLVAIAGRVRDAGADAVTLVNTVLGMALDPDTGRPALGHGGGGLSGRAIHPVAVRAVHDVRAAYADLPIVGVGGVADGWSAAELIMAGADAVQVGTATFADPAAPFRVAADLEAWLTAHGHRSVGAIRGRAHG